jgi:signal transduction histidine kinase/CheY-like chemotaxis protein
MTSNAMIAKQRPIERLRASVVLRLFVVVFAFSCIVTVGLTAVQLYREYRHGLELLQGRLSEVDRIYGGSVAEALWRLDRSELLLELDGMRRIDGISAVQVREAGNDPLIVSVGKPAVTAKTISRDFPIMREVQGAQRLIGTLHVEATLADVYSRVERTAVLILVNQATNTFLVALFITLLLNRLITRHLGAIARAVARYDHRAPPTPLTLDRHANAVPDELDRVVSAINAMASRVYRAYLDERDAAAEREARLAAEAANSAKSAFLASMSHELRTPLNGILGYAQILRRDASLADGHREAVGVILRCGEQLHALIHEVLDFAMIEAGRARVEVSDVSLAAVVSAIREVVVVKAAEKGLCFVCEVAPGVPAGVRADERRLRQVLLNLLTNAIKFTAEGSVELRVRRSGNGGATFEVSDTGCGIDADELDSIFMPFKQGRRTADGEGGMGLGLAISRQFVLAMGGDIVAESEVGRGSVFRFDLPPAVDADSFAPVQESERIVTGYEGARRTVLVIDDIEVNRAVASDWLRRLGFDVIAVETAEQGLREMTRTHVSLVLTDIVMPGIDGLEFIRRVRAHPELRDVPIIALSATSSAINAGKTLAAGANAFLPKPVDFNHLQIEMAALLGLNWNYELQPQQSAADPQQFANVVLPVPPAETMGELLRLARMGDMRAVRNWADALSAGDARYQPFAAALGAFARGYQSRALLAFVERHLRHGGGT